MKFFKGLLFFFVCFTAAVQAQDQPLRVGIGRFYPPFIMQGADNELFGFDIETAIELCNIMHRTCSFYPMRFKDLLPAINRQEIDMAINAISITPERLKLVNFSNPYLLTYSRFLTNRAYTHQPFSLALLNDKRIGVDGDSIFEDEIKGMDIKNPTIVPFYGVHSTEEMLEALENEKIDFVILDNPSALYWAANSSGEVKTVGRPIPYGYGLGIAVNLNNNALLQSINHALLQYEFSKQYIKIYNKYILQF
ncbi:arginine-binding periplasmic protein [Legionella sainthelensi]|uniref:Arginine ABC transporter substrate-binding protein n=1 Tax=Legionella sainthelensi TaxID=28087 RepID=A0A2H5FLI7_9GAMM|nr:transporter substrate-binding domain-containing protein [Legionella sainthelensi]AUH72415.1 arginine ABC transporter substrate-binding protein [Legionella sainthelensi]VEB34995.1 arginine-binding periplasmic protein [Legionella sainthelensi]